MNKKKYLLKRRIIALFIIVCIILLLQICISQYFITNTITEKTLMYFQETVDQIGKRLDLQLKQYEDIVLDIANNKVIINYLTDLKCNRISDYNIAKFKIIREILKLTNLSIIENMYIFTYNYLPINCYYSKAILEIDPYIEYLIHNHSLVYDGNENIMWKVLNKKPFEISIFSHIKTQKELVGLLMVTFNETFLSNIIDKAKVGNTGSLYLVDDNYRVIYAKDRNLINESFLLVKNNLSSTIGDAFLTVKCDLNYKGWTLIAVIPEIEISTAIRQFNKVFFVMVFVTLTVITIFAIVIIRDIFNPLKKILRGMESVQKGDLNITLENDAGNEFSVIIDNFNYMVKRIKSLVQTIYQQQVYYRKTQFLSLQSKLNPHFLYNTLDALYWMVILKGEEEIGDAILALSSILRYSISHQNEFVTVREDMEQLENYLKIQKLRFRDKLKYEFHVTDEIKEFKIPKLLIQPLVENAIKHAFKEMKYQGIIYIYGYIKDENLIFEVIDNGIGMSNEEIKSLFETNELIDKKSGIGIQLVNNRIKYIYGEEYGLSIDSIIGEGTKITVKLRKRPIFDYDKLLD